jgi:phospholipid/cholesterol/gamma-HCH transport system permease protein
MKWLASVLQSTVEILALLTETIGSLKGLRRHPERLRAELSSIGTGSLLFLFATSAFMGVIIVFQTATQINKAIPDLTLLGAGFIRVMTAEMIPLLTGLMVSARVGSAISSEVASMVVTEQMDALRLANTDPTEYIVAPKLVASVVAVPVLGMVSLATGITAGMLIGWSVFEIHPSTFLNFRYTYEHHFLSCCLKLAAFGRQGAFSVGQAATRGVIMSSFFVFAADLALSVLDRAAWGL